MRRGPIRLSICSAILLVGAAAAPVTAPAQSRPEGRTGARSEARPEARAEARSASQAEADLKRLQTEIQRIRGQVARDAAERDRLARSLRAAEQSAAAARTELQRLQGERSEREQRRAELAGERRDRERDLQRERDALAAQARAAYVMGREDPLRMLLDDADPARADRLRTYHAFFGRARAEQVARIEAAVRGIERIDEGLATEQREIARLEQRQGAEVTRLDEARTERGKVLAQLTAESRARAASLQRMQREQAALERLLRELRRAAAAQQFPSDGKSPFAAMRGKLAWPVPGRLSSRFGERRAGTVRWDGVMIAADRGTPVRAVYRGRVVYADWLAGLGLLLILDHGGGYLSLYGHNEQLFRAVGDTVAPGDTLAAVGDSGGRPSPSLYFEIRQAAKPIDPAPWFSRPSP
jgi:septal ring factor EnvC (AmiA/AmiB activator)